MGWTSARRRWVSALCLHLLVVHASSLKYHLTSTPAIEGQPFTLSCRQDHTIGTALWYRNWVRIFQTNRNYQFEMLEKNTDHEEFRSVSGRISVHATLIRHNVILTINSTLDEGSVWRCGLGEDSSDNLTVRVVKPVTGESTTRTPTALPTATTPVQCARDDTFCKPVLVPVAAGVGATLVIAVAVNVLIWYRVIATRKQKTKDKKASTVENNEYNLTTYGDHHDSGDYSDLASIRPVSLIEPIYRDAMEMHSDIYINAVDDEATYESPVWVRDHPDIS
ncbi:uncharacterized protein LOC124119247 [Haliotis rufescens]|uniref:uncharacterized protein LOC124119247 n=1 Tax=Haliotis rufescens TaxID=6454 RepID=UPI00201FAE92|nr:uncharacterized protein LOC124119247 [Haliotis rufescens]